MARAEWRNAPDFAQFAEALRCNTTQIMAVAPQEGGAFMVFYTPHGEGVEAEVYAAVLKRDHDEIIRQTGTSVRQPDFLKKLKEAMEG